MLLLHSKYKKDSRLSINQVDYFGDLVFLLVGLLHSIVEEWHLIAIRTGLMEIKGAFLYLYLLMYLSIVLVYTLPFTCIVYLKIQFLNASFKKQPYFHKYFWSLVLLQLSFSHRTGQEIIFLPCYYLDWELRMFLSALALKYSIDLS